MDFDRLARENASSIASRVTRAAVRASDDETESNSATQDALPESGADAAPEAAPSILSGRQVGVLANFGIGPENLDDEAQARMAHAIDRLDGMLACTGGDEAACAALGPAPISLSGSTGTDGGEQEILLEEADYTLSLKVSTDPLTGETTSRLLYIDADGTYISGLSNQSVETLFAPEAEAEAAAATKAASKDPNWLSTLAGIDAEYDVLARAGGAIQAAGGAADLWVAVPLLFAPEPVLTKVAAAAAALRGLDDLQAGARTVLSGEPTETATQTLATDAAEALGADPDTAKSIGLAVDMVTGIINPAGRLRHMTTAASERLAMEAAEQAGKHGDDAAKLVRDGDELAEQGAKSTGTAEKQLTEAGLNKPVPLTPQELAAVMEWQNLRNGYLKKWREMDLSAYPEKTQHLLRGSADRAIRGGMTPDDLAAVIKEKRGIAILNDEGKVYDHLTEAEESMRSVAEALEKINERIGYLYATAPGATAEIQVLKDKLSDLSTLLDAYERLQ